MYVVQSYSAIKKTETGPLASFLSVFLAAGRVTPVFLHLCSVTYPPLHPGAELFVAVMDPRGTTAKRQKWGRFLPHQRANVDQVPLPFVNDMEDTLDEEKGADRVERVCV